MQCADNKCVNDDGMQTQRERERDVTRYLETKLNCNGWIVLWQAGSEGIERVGIKKESEH